MGATVRVRGQDRKRNWAMATAIATLTIALAACGSRQSHASLQAAFVGGGRQGPAGGVNAAGSGSTVASGGATGGGTTTGGSTGGTTGGSTGGTRPGGGGGGTSPGGGGTATGGGSTGGGGSTS